ncbi:Lactate 2-monooxygenase like protein [Verticillium longisporum]|uniref:Lactate 2-monooxygenase like protein n=1 Tax=Verticillium longisporum TaxID=100787 RepID=A0A8I3A182_VERLO|nr:Lactate 2-monooxygenase like protein [Verticillium longisporum]
MRSNAHPHQSAYEICKANNSPRGNPLRTAGSTPRPTPRRPSRRAPGLPSALPTTSSSRIEDVASAHDAGRPAACTARAGDVRIPAVPRFFQFYTPHDDELTVSLLRCAHESGSTTSMQRTDTWQLGWRHVDVATSNRDLNRGSGADLGLSDPFFRARLRGKGIDPAEQPEKATAMWMDSIWHGRAWSWDKAVRALSAAVVCLAQQEGHAVGNIAQADQTC